MIHVNVGVKTKESILWNVIFVICIYIGKCEASGDGSTFIDLITNLNFAEGRTILLIVGVAIVLVSIQFTWEVFNDFTEHLLNKNNQKHLLDMKHQFYKELTLLGFISMTLFVITHVVSFDQTLYYLFEFVHYSLFFMVFFEIVLVLAMALLSTRIFVHWEHLETKKELLQKEFDSLEQLENKSRVNPIYYWNVARAQSFRQFHSIRDRFMEQHHLSQKFAFSKYLKRSMKSVFSEMVEMPWTVDAAFLVIQLVLWIPFAVADVDATTRIVLPWTIIAMIVIIGTGVLLAKTISILNALSTNTKILKTPTLSRRENQTDMEKQVQQVTMASIKSRSQLMKNMEEQKEAEITSQNDDNTKTAQNVVTIRNQDKKQKRKKRGEDNKEAHLNKKNVSQRSSHSRVKMTETPQAEVKEGESTSNYLANSGNSDESFPNDEQKENNVFQTTDDEKDEVVVEALTLPKRIADSYRPQSTADISAIHPSPIVQTTSPYRVQREQDSLEDEIKSLNSQEDIKEESEIASDYSSESAQESGYTSESSWSETWSSESTWESESSWEESETEGRNPNDLTTRNFSPKVPVNTPQLEAISSLSSETDDKEKQKLSINTRKRRHHHHHHIHHHHHHVHHHRSQGSIKWSKAMSKSIPCWPLITKVKNRKSNPTNKSAHRVLFWFDSPNFLHFLLQLVLLFQGLFVAINVGFATNFLTKEFPIGIDIMGLIISLFVIICIMPLIIYNYSIIINVGEYTKDDILEEVTQKHKDYVSREPAKVVYPGMQTSGKSTPSLMVKSLSAMKRSESRGSFESLASVNRRHYHHHHHHNASHNNNSNANLGQERNL